jgi:hypothetical protein
MREDESGGSRPVPDPTVLTTEALRREIEHAREAASSQRELLETQIEALGDACEAKFQYIEQRFRDRDRLVDAAFDSSKEAVSAALAASKEAVSKSEHTFNKQLDEMKLTMAAANKGIEDQIGAVKERVTIMESVDRGIEKKSDAMSNATTLVISGLLLLLSAVGVIIAIVASRPG